MTAPVDRDREELARVLRGALVRPPVGGETNWDRALRIAAALLASPVVARREARAKAEERQQIRSWLLASGVGDVRVLRYLRERDARAAALDTEGKDR